MNSKSLAVAAALAATLAAPVVLADDTATTADALRVVRDKETGQLRAPSQGELKQLLDEEKAARKARGEPEPAADAQPVEVREYGDGMKAAVLGPEFFVTVLVERDENGELVIRHANPADDHAAAPASKLPTE
jgi:hypothetical protein